MATITEASRPYSGAFIFGVAQVAREAGINLMLSSGFADAEHESGAIEFRRERRCDRLHGYRRAREAAGVDYVERYVVESTFLEDGGAHATARLVDPAPELSVFVANDQMAAGAMRTLRENERDVPADVSVVGFDDVFLAQYLTPTLTTVRQPLVDTGRAAAHLLLARLGHGGEEVLHRFDPEPVERQSVGRSAR